MSAFIPVNKGKLYKARNEYTVTGQRAFSQPVEVGLSVIRLASSVSPTSVRADKSGTKSYADEELFKGRVLIHPRVKPKEGDVLEVFGEKYLIEGVRDVRDMSGRLDHYQVELDVWSSE